MNRLLLGRRRKPSRHRCTSPDSTRSVKLGSCLLRINPQKQKLVDLRLAWRVRGLLILEEPEEWVQVWAVTVSKKRFLAFDFTGAIQYWSEQKYKF